MSTAVTVDVKSPSSKMGKIRVGKIEGKHFPTYDGYQQIIVKTKSDGGYWQLSPYYLTCPIPGSDKTGLVECVFQACKAYKQVYAQREVAKWNSSIIIWEHPAETHLDIKDNVCTIRPEYFKWREKLATNKLAVRYPNGYYGRHECICSLLPDEKGGWRVVGGQGATKEQRYIAARKEIYVPLYGEAAKSHQRYQELVTLLQQGVNILILDVDGPKYTEKYPFNQIEKGSIEINEANIKALINDTTQAFGHGAVAAAYLLGGKEWMK